MLPTLKRCMKMYGFHLEDGFEIYSNNDAIIKLFKVLADEKNISMRSRDTVYRLGDRIKIKVEEADISAARLRFSIYEERNL